MTTPTYDFPEYAPIPATAYGPALNEPGPDGFFDDQ